jgi:hypothetical protein
VGPTYLGNYCWFIRSGEETSAERKKIILRYRTLAFSSSSFSYDILISWKHEKIVTFILK